MCALCALDIHIGVCVHAHTWTNKIKKLRARKSHDHRIFSVAFPWAAFAFHLLFDDVHWHWCVIMHTLGQTISKSWELEKVTIVVFSDRCKNLIVECPCNRFCFAMVGWWCVCALLPLIFHVGIHNQQWVTFDGVCVQAHTQRQARKKVKNFIEFLRRGGSRLRLGICNMNLNKMNFDRRRS